MGAFSSQIVAMFEIDAKTWTMIVIVTGFAVWFMRHGANIMQMLVFMPAAVLFSVVANHALVLLHVYQPEKLAEWMVWVIAAATVGNLVALSLVVLFAGIMDREADTPPPAKR